MAKQFSRIIDSFYGGIQRDKKSRVPGGCLNIEEIDIFSNKDYIQAEQIMSADAMPTDTVVTAYTADNADTVFGYGKETAENKVRLVKVTTGGASNPGAFATAFTSADATDVFYLPSPIEYFRQDNGNKNFLYYLTNASGTVKLKSYDITAETESETDSVSQNMTLTGLSGSYDRCFMRVGFGELFIGNGQYIAKVDKDGVFTEKAFTLPNGWNVVDITFVSDIGIILARSANRFANYSKGFWWDLTSSAQVDDSFDIPFGGPQWIVNHKENIRFLCAQNGYAKFYQLSGAFPGAEPKELPGLLLTNVASDGTTQPISSPNMVDTKDNILYFGLNKTDKTGVYAIGQLDSDKPIALILSKRFHTSDYSKHVPYAVFTQGSNFYGAFADNGTAANCRCETLNSPSRSSNAVYESVILDEGDPTKQKVLEELFVLTEPLPASTSVTVSVAKNYGSYTVLTRPDGSNTNTTSGLVGYYRPGFADSKLHQIKLTLASNETISPKITGIAYKISIDDLGSAT